MKSQDIIDFQRKVYSKNFSHNPQGPNATFNQTESHQTLRYENLFNWLDFPLDNLSVFDVGCGIGELNDWLSARVKHLKYHGNDIVPEMVEAARERIPECDIRSVDLSNDPDLPKADIYCLSGVFNFHGGMDMDKWEKYCQSMVTVMFQHSKIGICFNGLSTSADYYDEAMFYSSSQQWVSFLNKECSRFIGVKADYALFEHSIYVLQPDWVRSQTSPELTRYVKNRED